MESSDGMKWVFPKCVNCKHSDGKFCKYYKDDKDDLVIDIFNCKHVEEEHE